MLRRLTIDESWEEYESEAHRVKAGLTVAYTLT